MRFKIKKSGIKDDTMTHFKTANYATQEVADKFEKSNEDALCSP